jgi:hypothetical protein
MNLTVDLHHAGGTNSQYIQGGLHFSHSALQFLTNAPPLTILLRTGSISQPPAISLTPFQLLGLVPPMSLQISMQRPWSAMNEYMQHLSIELT